MRSRPTPARAAAVACPARRRRVAWHSQRATRRQGLPSRESRTGREAAADCGDAGAERGRERGGDPAPGSRAPVPPRTVAAPPAASRRAGVCVPSSQAEGAAAAEVTLPVRGAHGRSLRCGGPVGHVCSETVRTLPSPAIAAPARPYATSCAVAVQVFRRAEKPGAGVALGICHRQRHGKCWGSRRVAVGGAGAPGTRSAPG